MKSIAHILVVDDESKIRESISSILKDEGFKVSYAADGKEAIERIKQDYIDLVILDIWMPGTDDGITVLQKIKTEHPHIAVIMISGHGNIETAVKITKMGAYDFIEKPLSLEKIILTVNNALHHNQLEIENRLLKKKVADKYKMIGNSLAMKELREQINLAAPTNGRVLIYGENGTGKELVARAIHNQSIRKDKPFIEVNCAAIPEELIESELFGYEKGAFTGAIKAKKGRFELADGGTIFLDEIGDMSLKTQAKVLRVIENQTVEPLGSTKTISIDVRVIAASNKDLTHEIEKKNFREDLYYRLNVIPFYLKSLKERSEDIPLLADYFIDAFCMEYGRAKKEISKNALELLIHYNWPGNIRELKNIMERLVIMVKDRFIDIKDIAIIIRQKGFDLHNKSTSKLDNLLSFNNLRSAKEEFEKAFIVEQLKLNQNNISKTAKAIDIERSNLHKKLKQYKIKQAKFDS
ncbi:MAG: sigma-54 dependent transcriptional regulator [bacterium]